MQVGVIKLGAPRVVMASKNPKAGMGSDTKQNRAIHSHSAVAARKARLMVEGHRPHGPISFAMCMCMCTQQALLARLDVAIVYTLFEVFLMCFCLFYIVRLKQNVFYPQIQSYSALVSKT